MNSRIFSATAFVFSLLLSSFISGQVVRFIPTSEVVRVASMAALDDGFDVKTHGVYLDELRTKDGKEPINGYASIGLYKGGHLAHSYAIRIETGDVVDTQSCRLLHYPNLLRFRGETMKEFGTRSVNAERIAEEVGCDSLSVIPSQSSRKQ